MNIIIPRKNNFGILRLLFALTVVLVHMYDLTLNPKLEIISKLLSSKIAVDGFFVISGFLIFMSYENSPFLKEYFSKRVRRIYPAYFLVIIMCATLGVFLSELSMPQYFSVNFIKYLVANLFFLNMLQPTLPGVFLDNPVMPAVNGALWTIKIEVMFYCIVPILVYLMRRYNKLIVIIFFYIASYIYVLYFNNLADITGKRFYIELARQLPGQLSYFLSGTLLYYFFDVFFKNRHKILTIGIIGYIIGSHNFILSCIEPISLAILVIYLAFFIPEISFIEKYGDLSYGTYLYHFPIIQTFISLNLFQISPYFSLISILCVVLILAIFSWNLWEKPFIQRVSFRKFIWPLSKSATSHQGRF